MAHSFTISLAGKDIATEISKIKAGLAGSGGTFAGDIQSGNFSGSGVVGHYLVTAGAQIEITITKKPFVAPMSLVEKKIRSYFGC